MNLMSTHKVCFFMEKYGKLSHQIPTLSVSLTSLHSYLRSWNQSNLSTNGNVLRSQGTLSRRTWELTSQMKISSSEMYQLSSILQQQSNLTRTWSEYYRYISCLPRRSNNQIWWGREVSTIDTCISVVFHSTPIIKFDEDIKWVL